MKRLHFSTIEDVAPGQLPSLSGGPARVPRLGGQLSAGSCVLLRTQWSGASLRVLVIAAPSTLDWSTPALPVVSSVRDRLLYIRMQISFPAEVLQWCRCRKTLSLLWSLMVKTSYLAQAGGWRLVFQESEPLAICFHFCQALGGKVTSDLPVKPGHFLQPYSWYLFDSALSFHL